MARLRSPLLVVWIVGRRPYIRSPSPCIEEPEPWSLLTQRLDPGCRRGFRDDRRSRTPARRANHAPFPEQKTNIRGCGQLRRRTAASANVLVHRRNKMPVSIQFLSALQKLEQIRETTPQLPRLVEPFARVRRHATDTVQRRSTEPPRQNARHRRTSEDTSCRTPPSPGNPFSPRIFNAASSHFLQQTAGRLAHAWYFRRASGPPPPGGTFPARRQLAPKSPRKFFQNLCFQRVGALAGIAVPLFAPLGDAIAERSG